MANQYRSVLASSGPAPTGGDAVAAEVLSGKTFTNDNGLQTGSMTNNGAVSQTIAAGSSYTIPEGYHNGNGIVSASYSQPLLNTALTMRVNNEGKYALVTTGYNTVTIQGNLGGTVYAEDGTTSIGTITSGASNTININGNDVIFIQGDSQGNLTVTFTS